MYMSQEPNKTNTEDEIVIPHINKKFAITVVVIFLAMLVLPTIAWGAIRIVAVFEPSIMDSFNVDTGENRTMASFPDSFDPQTIAAEVENWYNDNLPFRSVLYNAQKNLENALERPYRNEIMPFLVELFHGSGEPEAPTPGDEVIVNPFDSEETESEIVTETETLPQFVIETETESGVAVCQHSYSDEPTMVLEATCTEYGIVGYECTECGHIGNKSYTHKTAHDYVSSVKELPLCGTKYSETLVCKECKDRVHRELVKKHLEGRKIRTVEATVDDYGYTLMYCSDCGGEFRSELKPKLNDNSFFPPVEHGQTLAGRRNWLFYLGDDSLKDYQGTNLMMDDELANAAAVLQQLDDVCKAKGIKFAIAYFPNKELVYPEYMPTYETYPYKRVALFTEYLKQNTSVTVVYPLNELKAAKPYWQVYYKHDTHWNQAGAFIGTQALYEAMGFETTRLIDLPVTTVARNGGDLINIGKLSAADYTGDVGYSIKYKPDVTLKNINPNPINNHTTHFSSNGQYDMNFVMLSDSFRGGMADILRKDFTNCFLTHRSQVNDADVVAAVKAADVLVISAVERSDTSVISTAKTVIGILTQDD